MSITLENILERPDMTLAHSARTSPRAARFWNRIAKKYARSPISDEASYQRKLEETQALMRPDMQVLEFGCGTGSTAITHAAHVAQITAIDISHEMIAIAQNKAAEAQIENIDFIVSDIGEFVGAEQKYDMILGLSILHLTPDRDATLKSVYEMLEPGGYFISSTPCIADIMPVFKLIAGAGYTLGLLPLVRVFGRGAFEQSIVNAGFEIETAWQPGPKSSLFVIARKPLTAS